MKHGALGFKYSTPLSIFTILAMAIRKIAYSRCNIDFAVDCLAVTQYHGHRVDQESY